MNPGDRARPPLTRWFRFVRVICLLLLLSLVKALWREPCVQDVQPGIDRARVEQLLGQPRLRDEDVLDCLPCNRPDERVLYRGNPTLWFLHLEDWVEVCFQDEVVCQIRRYGL